MNRPAFGGGLCVLDMNTEIEVTVKLLVCQTEAIRTVPLRLCGEMYFRETVPNEVL